MATREAGIADVTAPKPKAVRVRGPIPDPGKAPETTGRIFLLSPADCSGPRAVLLHRPESDHDLARRLRGADGAALGDVFTFVSSLYFRGKLASARAFARPPCGLGGTFVITPSDGLLAPESPVTLGDMSRGGLLLRCVREGRELGYAPILGAERHGVRPPRLAPIARSR